MKNYTFEEARKMMKGTCEYNGKTYALTEQADYYDETETQSIYSAPAIEEGTDRQCVVYFRFDSEDVDNVVNGLDELDWDEAYEVEYED